jgi:pyrroline-5-carboxylate reductase
MKECAIGIIGGGRIARIILTGWERAHRSISDVVVTDTDGAILERLHSDFPAIAVSRDNREAATQDVVLVAVHPPVFPTVLGEMREGLRQSGILVSLAPRWTMSRMCTTLGGFNRLARVIPNAPSIVNQGYNPVSYSEGLTGEDRESVRSLFAPLGTFPEVAEETLEAYAIVAAMGPTYLWYQLYQLIELGRDFGLTREAATEAVAAMVNGSVDTIVSAGLEPDGVMDLIPVKPLAAIEPAVKQAYADTLRGLHEKLKG